MLTPLITVDNDEDVVIQQQEDIPSKTYLLDLETGEIYPQFIDERDAIEQAALKAILTMRDNYLIYSSDYGSDIFDLFGESFSQEYLELEVPNMIQDALSVDDRIQDVINFDIEVINDEIHISFEIVTLYDENIQIQTEVII